MDNTETMRRYRALVAEANSNKRAVSEASFDGLVDYLLSPYTLRGTAEEASTLFDSVMTERAGWSGLSEDFLNGLNPWLVPIAVLRQLIAFDKLALPLKSQGAFGRISRQYRDVLLLGA